MILYKTTEGPVVRHDGGYASLGDTDFDALLCSDNLRDTLEQAIADARSVAKPETILAPIGVQEVWAAGVTYLRSRTARMEESKDAGGGDFYDRVYHADRPELFFKATPHRVVGPGAGMPLRSDSTWMVPEPELTLLINPAGSINGYTIGNDLSCRDIEGENPLYLPQAKTWDRSASLGPGIWVPHQRPGPDTDINIQIVRGGASVFDGHTDLGQMKKTLDQLVGYLFSNNAFPNGCFLMTGTGTVPPDDFTLKPGDRVDITVEPIGTLSNTMESPAS